MKILLLILILNVQHIFAQETTVPFYILTQPINAETVFLYDNGKITTNVNKIGVVYSHQKCQLDFNTYGNGNLKMCLSDGTIICLDENVQFKMHTIEATKVNNTNTASIVKYTNQNYIFSLMSGVVDIVSDTSGAKITFQTPRVSFTMIPGKYRVIVDDKITIIAVIEGKSVLNRIVESAEKEITAGNFSHVTTYYSLFTKGTPSPNSNRSTSIIKPISPDDLLKMKTKLSESTRLTDDIIFADVCGSIHGIKIR